MEAAMIWSRLDAPPATRTDIHGRPACADSPAGRWGDARPYERSRDAGTL